MKSLNKKDKKNIIGAITLGLIFVIFIAAITWKGENQSITTSYQAFNEYVEAGRVESVTLQSSSTFRYRLKGEEVTYITDDPRNPALKETLLLSGIQVTESGQSLSYVQTGLSLAVFAGVFYYGFKALSKQTGRASMALNPEEAGPDNRLLLNHVAGSEEAKESVQDIIDFLKNPEEYEKYGARMPRGIIFYGPPGTGKTLMAKAIAGEAGVSFYAVNGSDFVQMYVGVGASRIRELFKKAREAGKAVIFIDEIDALGKRRGNASMNGNDEREQTLNALLSEMSGFSSGDGIVIIAATNRLDTLDEALVRPGRFDRRIEIGMPDFNAREKILRLHGAGKPMSGQVDYKKLARQTVFFSGAMLENLLNEAAILAAKNRLEEITPEDVEKAYYLVVAGSEKKDRSGIRERDRQVTAYHEAGHGIIAKLVSTENKVSKITIIPNTNGAGGFCINIPPDKMYYTRLDIENQIMVSLAGRAAEEIVFGQDQITTGASNDLERATMLARDYIGRYGMGDSLANREVLMDSSGLNQQCVLLLEKLYEKTKSIICEKRELLSKVADALLQKETLHEDEFEEMTRSFSNVPEEIVDNMDNTN